MCGYCMSGDADRLMECEQVVRQNTPLRNVIGEAICDKADLIFLVWNEDVMELQ